MEMRDSYSVPKQITIINNKSIEKKRVNMLSFSLTLIIGIVLFNTETNIMIKLSIEFIADSIKTHINIK